MPQHDSSTDMLQWQYKTLLGEIQQVGLHSSGDCPCILNELNPPERCIGKHTLNIFTLAVETARMDSANRKMLLALADEAEGKHEAFKEFICHKGGLPELSLWSREAQKKIEPIYYLCGVKKPHGAHVADPGAVAEKVAAHTHWPTDREKVVAVYTGPRDKVLAVRTVAQGDKHTAPLPVPHIVREAKAQGAQGITILHNHPSGTTEISAEDRQATDMLKTAAHHAGIHSVHHIVVGHGATARVADKVLPSGVTMTISGRCSPGKVCNIKVKGSEPVTKFTAAPGELPQVIAAVEKELAARKGKPFSAETFAIGPSSLTRYDLRHRLVEADKLITSHNPQTFALEPGYPQELQPRMRDRAATQAQVLKIAANIDPESLLVDFHSIDRGSPIVGGIA